jgi:Family of unknown function (DUF6111)
LTEVLLFLAPFAAFVVWRVTLGGGGPSRPVLIGAICAVVLLTAMLVWLRRENAIGSGAAYVPAELKDGRIVPGHAAPR